MSALIRRLAMTTAAAAGSLGIAVAAAPTSSATPIWTLHHKATVTTYVAKPGKTVVFTGDQTSKVDLGSRKNNLTAALRLGNGTMPVDLPIIPGKLSIPGIGTATLKIEPTADAKGDLVDGKISVTQSFTIHVTKVTPSLLPSVNLVPSTCRTTTPVVSRLTGTIKGLFDTFTLKGNYTIPSFTGCGLLDPIITSLTSGSGNTMKATFAPD